MPTLASLLSLLLLLLLVASSQRGAFLAPLTSSVYHAMTAARGIDVILPWTTTPAVALAIPDERNATNVALSAFGYNRCISEFSSTHGRLWCLQLLYALQTAFF